MTHENLQAEAERTRYVLRASFYYRMHDRWYELLALVEKAAADVAEWEERDSLGISEAAWDTVSSQGINPTLAFCHPGVLRQHPTLGTYYRCLALLPQKGLAHLAGVSAAFENKTSSRLGQKQATTFAQTVNRLISLLIESDPDWNLEDARTAALLNLGSQVNGSWRNEIGIEGSRRVKALLLTMLGERGVAAEVRAIDNTMVDLGQAKPERVREVKLTSGHRVVFGTEPDVSVLAADGTLLATIEVKYGLDPAGALERYGAAKKSFDQAIRQNARVTNIYLASCFTEEVRRRIRDDRVVSDDHNLIAVLEYPEPRGAFLRRFASLLGRS